MKSVYTLEIGDTLIRTKPRRDCEIKGITIDRLAMRVFELDGILVSQNVMSKMFENENGRFVVK